MRYSTKLSDTIHVLVLLALWEKEKPTSIKIAESVKTNPAYIRQLMSLLKSAEIISNTQGQANPRLIKSPDNITLLEIYKAVEGNKPLLHLDIHTNPQCGVGVNIQSAIGSFYSSIQKVAEDKMQGITLKDIIDEYKLKIDN